MVVEVVDRGFTVVVLGVCFFSSPYLLHGPLVNHIPWSVLPVRWDVYEDAVAVQILSPEPRLKEIGFLNLLRFLVNLEPLGLESFSHLKRLPVFLNDYHLRTSY